MKPRRIDRYHPLVVAAIVVTAALVFPERAVGFLAAAAFVLAADTWTKALNSENARRNDERRRRETAAQLEKMRSERRRRNTRNIGKTP